MIYRKGARAKINKVQCLCKCFFSFLQCTFGACRRKVFKQRNTPKILNGSKTFGIMTYVRDKCSSS